MVWFAADFISLLGNAAIGLVLPWLVLIRTGDAAAAGLVAACTAAPALAAAVLGGSLADRVGRRTIAVIADAGSAVSVVLLFLVDTTLGLTIGWFVALGVLGAVFDVPGLTARQSMLPEVARASGMTLERASGIRQALFGASFLVGPALAGAALAVLPPQAVLLITAGCSALAGLLTALLPRALNQHGESGGGLIGHVGEGLRLLRTVPVALATTILGVGSVLAISPLQAVVLPVVFLALDQPALLGLTLSVFAVGLIGGSLLYGVVSTPLDQRGVRIPRRTLLVTAMFSALVGLIGFAVAPVPGVIVASAVLVGLGYGLINPMIPVLISERVPESARARVLGLQNAGYLAAFPLGALAVGFVVQHIGVQAGAAASASAWALCVVYGLTVPALRRDAIESGSGRAGSPG
ncbi:MFS transporter [soil metagenome]